MSQEIDEKKLEKPELEDEELDEVSGGTGARELGEKGIQPDMPSQLCGNQPPASQLCRNT